MDPQRPIYPQRVRKKRVGPIWRIWCISPKLSIGTIENASAASDLPPEGPKKKSWADLTHLAHISKLALGTIKNGSAVSDLPPEDPKKNVGLI